VADLSSLVCRAGHEVHIFTLASKIQERPNLHIHILRSPLRPKFLRTLSFAVNCRRQVKRGDFTIVHSFGRSWGMDVFQPLGGAQMASLVGNIRSIHNPAGKLLKILTYLFSLRRFIYFLVEWVQMKEARTVIAISAVVKKDLIHYNHLPAVKVRIVRNGVDLDKFHIRNREIYREETRKGLKLEDGDILILFVAHNFRLKGLRPLIDAMAELRMRYDHNSFKLGVLGDGKKSAFSRYARKKGVGDKVIFIGGRADTPRYYAAADICVHPSFYDPSALVVMEAMASGLPVITAAYCGTSEIIEDGKEGYVVGNPDNTGELTDRILKLKDYEKRNFMGRQARRRAKQFPYARNMQQILEIYDEYSRLGSRS